MDLAADRLGAADRTLVYTYYSELDGMGHRHGVDSDAWRGQLMMVDRLAQRLAEQLPPRSALYVTADHGMIDIPFDERAASTSTRTGSCAPGSRCSAARAAPATSTRCPAPRPTCSRCGARCSASRCGSPPATRPSTAGWFGPSVDERVLGRIGDVVAAARDDIAVIATRSASRGSPR